MERFSEGARVAFGGKALEGHSIPSTFGAIEPTAVFVPLREILSDSYFKIAMTEIFGPVQVHFERFFFAIRTDFDRVQRG